MTFHHKKTSFAGLAALAVGALVALTPSTSEAATIRIQDLNGVDPDFFVSDTGHLTVASTARVIGGTLFQSVDIGGMNVRVEVTPQENSGESVLNTVSVSTSGAGHIRITTSEDDFGAGARVPKLSNLAFSLTSTNASDGIPVARAYVNNSNALEAKEDMIGSTLSLPVVPAPADDSTSTSDTAALNNPFSMTSVFEIEHSGTKDFTQFNASVVAAVPLPAAGWLMIAGLGGLAALRRRKRAA